MGESLTVILYFSPTTESKEGVGGPFHCQKCKVSFISDLSLKEHMDVHALNTGICCDVCDINFSHNHVLKTHQIACHSKGDFFKRKNLGEVLNQFLQNKTQCDSNVEDASDSDFDDVSNVEAIRREFADIASSVKSEDSLEDGEDYHPSMAVECILDSSDDEVQNNGEVNEQLGHKCSICRESFASLIALKEHSSLHCINQKLSKPGHFKRRKKTMLYGKSLVGSCIRCIDCQSVFTDRSNYLEHFSSYPCSSVRQRIEYTDEEQKILVTHYDRNNFPLPSDMSLLARRLGVRYRQIMYWFQNRRNKERRRSKEGKRTPPIECQKCKASFVTEENLKRHQDNIHGGETSVSKTEHVCPAIGCEAVFYNSELLVTHSLVHQLGTDALRPDELGDPQTAVISQVDIDDLRPTEETVSHRVPKLGTPALWTDFNILEAHYSDNNFPDPMDIGFIARRLKVAPLRVHTWFKVS
ncbi:hypothetical protein SK128_012734 [Halocaridina rubra]|uniref:Uncharacterized protein n=1 Tax=Halocaridina rubra TaxID=373956 RepID=A0AAN8ZZS2_HALRR